MLNNKLIEPPNMLNKQDESAKVARDVKRFLREGGKIQKIPEGVSAVEDLSAGRRKKIVLSARRGGKK